MSALRGLVYIYELAIIARIILSYFPVSEGSAMATVYSFLYRITEPVLGPVRRVLPTVGMIDFSPMVVLLGLGVLVRLLAP